MKKKHQMAKFKKEDVEKIECRFAIHLREKPNGRPDLHYIKEQVHLKSGEVIPNVRLVKDFKRPVRVTLPRFRDHKEHKEFEDLDKTVEIVDTQSKIDHAVARFLGEPHRARDSRLIKEVPYVYGYDITSTSHVKLRYLQKNDFIQTTYSLSILDIENDIDTKEILMITVLFKTEAFTYVTEKFVNNFPNFVSKVQEKKEQILAKYPEIKMTVKVCPGEVSVIDEAFKRLHERKPDFVSIWNMSYDIEFILARLQHHNVNPIDILCDPDIPRAYRMCWYKEGRKKTITASGKVRPIPRIDQWSTLYLTASFYVICAMRTYRQVRMGMPLLPSYALDAVLDKELKDVQKLKFEQADIYEGAEWHRFMQKNYPAEYTVYNVFDCYVMWLLEEKTKDVQNSLPLFADITDFDKFNSNPTKIVNSLYLFGLEKNKIVGSSPPSAETIDKLKGRFHNLMDYEFSGDDNDDDDDEESIKTLGLKGWIVTLPAHLLLPMGLNIFKDYPNLKTNIRGLVLDSDAISAYPSATIAFNVSKATTLFEIIDILGVDPEMFKIQNIGLAAGDSNHIEYTTRMFNAPRLHELL